MPLSQIRRGLPQPGGMASERQTFDFATCTCLLAAQNFYFFDYLKNHANSIELHYFGRFSQLERIGESFLYKQIIRRDR